MLLDVVSSSLAPLHTWRWILTGMKIFSASYCFEACLFLGGVPLSYYLIVLLSFVLHC